MIRRRIASSIAIAAAVATVGIAAAPAATADTGNRSLAAVLTSDGDRFDRSWYDYDIVTEAVLAVLAAKPESKVGLLADGDVALTAFIPNDRAFQVLAADLTKRWSWSEEKVFTSLVAAVGVDAIEQVLLYHVVPGTAITASQALTADGATLTTAQGATIGVRVWSPRLRIVELRDQDRNDVNPFLVPRQLDVNAGNEQVAHGITFVLRPLDL